MHELSLCRSILGILQEQAERHRYRRVLRVEVRVGPRAMVEPEAMIFSFGVAARGTLAEGALLEIHPVAARAVCLDCGCEGRVAKLAQPCRQCGSYRLLVEEDIGLRLGEIVVD